MFISDARFPIIEGPVLEAFKEELSWSSLTVQLMRPDIMPKRLVTMRDDSGPQSVSTALHRKGINVWADSFIDSKNLALDVMQVARRLPLLVGPVKAVSEFVGPYEVADEPEFTFNGKPLVHHYFAFAITVKAT